MKFPSIATISKNAVLTARRFPFAVLAAFFGTIFSIIMIEQERDLGWMPNLLMTLILSFPLYVSAVLYGQENNWNKIKGAITNIIITVFLAAYYFLLPENLFTDESRHIIRYIIWAVAFAFTLSFIPFLRKGTETIKTFWHYNVGLGASISLTIIYGVSLFAGLSIAIASVDYLFELEVDGKIYPELWAVIVGIFSTLFFLNRFSKNILDFSIKEPPKELKIFSQFVLSPLVAIYFLILYSYSARILITGDWPKGVLAYMILGFSFFGVLTYMSLYIFRDSLNWVRKVGAAFYVILIPQIGMLFWALWFRIADYGITEKRYLVFIFGWWLLGMAIYFLISKKKDIRLIPITIFIIALFSSFGPWGAFAVSEKSQIGRLEKMLASNKILVSGKIKKSEEEVPLEDRREISAVLRYLEQVHGFSSIQKWFNENLENIEIEKNCQKLERCYFNKASIIAEDLLGVKYIDRFEIDQNKNDNFYLSGSRQFADIPLPVSDFDYIASIKNISVEREAPVRKQPNPILVAPEGNIGEIDGLSYTFKLRNTPDADFEIYENSILIAKVALQSLIEKGLGEQASNRLTEEDFNLRVDFENEKIKFALELQSIGGVKKDENYEISSLSGFLLFSLK